MKNISLIELGVTKGKLKQFESKGIENAEELLHFLPRKVFQIPIVFDVDHSMINWELVGVKAVLMNIVHTAKTIRLEFKTQNSSFDVIWFNMKHQVNKLNVGSVYYVVGKLETNKYRTNTLQFTMPKIVNRTTYDEIVQDILIEYSVITGMSRNYLEKHLKEAINLIPLQENLPLDYVSEHELLDKRTAYEYLHFPKTMEQYKNGLKRHTYETVYLQARGMLEMEAENRLDSDYLPITTGLVEKIKEDLPFELTDGQAGVLEELYEKAKKGSRINALIQGDVGSGKTITSILFMASMVEAGYQAAMLAPTSVLAEQHYEEIKERLEPYGVHVAYLNGKVATRKREKNKIVKALLEGEIDILVGTHAILQDDVVFKELGAAIVDEEHRFGTVDRDKLITNTNGKGVHMLRMSATPIPRSLALTMYSSSISIHSIKTLPKGRKPVKTAYLADQTRINNGIEMQIENGNQVYIVCPLIEESDSEIMDGVLSVEETYEITKKQFENNPKVKVGMLNGKMKEEEVKEVLDRYVKNEINVLISTTVIEVGINVPNATMIVIQNAERFGLAQLHQLRGRVGRSDIQSYCILTSPKGATKRIQAMTQTTDGFKIAEIDLELRGAGDMLGTKQSGKTEYMNVIQNNLELFESVRNDLMKEKELMV